MRRVERLRHPLRGTKHRRSRRDRRGRLKITAARWELERGAQKSAYTGGRRRARRLGLTRWQLVSLARSQTRFFSATRSKLLRNLLRAGWCSRMGECGVALGRRVRSDGIAAAGIVIPAVTGRCSRHPLGNGRGAEYGGRAVVGKLWEEPRSLVRAVTPVDTESNTG